MSKHRRERGFTLIELAMTLAVLGVVVGITVTGLQGLRPRAMLSSASAELTSRLAAARERAQAEGGIVWFGFFPETANSGIRYIMFLDWDQNFDYTTFDIEAPYASYGDNEQTAIGGAGQRRDRVLILHEFPRYVHRIPGSELLNPGSLPLPFQVTNFGAVPNGCSFCDPTGVGWIAFLPSGEVRLPLAPPGDRGGAILLGSGESVTAGDDFNRYIISLTAPFGMVRRFDDV